jgi:predicted butyrate kinase (DUF1464 family)
MGQDPDAILQESEQTRAEMSETVEAIGYKADVPSRAREAVADMADTVRSNVIEAASRAKEAVAGTASRAGDAGGGVTSRIADTARQRGQQHGQDLAASARRSAEEVRDQAGERIGNS